MKEDILYSINGFTLHHFQSNGDGFEAELMQRKKYICAVSKRTDNSVVRIFQMTDDKKLLSKLRLTVDSIFAHLHPSLLSNDTLEDCITSLTELLYDLTMIAGEFHLQRNLLPDAPALELNIYGCTWFRVDTAENVVTHALDREINPLEYTPAEIQRRLEKRVYLRDSNGTPLSALIARNRDDHLQLSTKEYVAMHKPALLIQKEAISAA